MDSLSLPYRPMKQFPRELYPCLGIPENCSVPINLQITLSAAGSDKQNSTVKYGTTRCTAKHKTAQRSEDTPDRAVWISITVFCLFCQTRIKIENTSKVIQSPPYFLLSPSLSIGEGGWGRCLGPNYPFMSSGPLATFVCQPPKSLGFSLQLSGVCRHPQDAGC